jgi:HEPN domain-containing protein
VLTPLYTGFRCPDVAEGDIEDAAELLKSAEEVVKWIEKQLTP